MVCGSLSYHIFPVTDIGVVLQGGRPRRGTPPSDLFLVTGVGVSVLGPENVLLLRCCIAGAP